MSGVAMRGGNRGETGSVDISAIQERGGDGLRVLTVRPRRSLFRRIVLQAGFVALPLIGIAIWSEQQFSRDSRWALAWSILILAALAVYVIVRYRRTEISVSPFGLVERGFFGGLNSVAARDVVSIVRLHTYRRASDETTPQLFLVGRDGRCLLRMRGAFWDDESMDAVSACLGVEEIVRPIPLTLSELRASDPKLLYWFEQGLLRRPAKTPNAAA
jgi:hypothetical protein